MDAWRVPISVAVLAILLFGPSEAFARGSQVLHDAPWNSEHIDHLPPEIRAAVIHMCGGLRAGHYFATYLDHAHVVKLHYEHFHLRRPQQILQWQGVPASAISLDRRPLSADQELLRQQQRLSGGYLGSGPNKSIHRARVLWIVADIFGEQA